MANGKALGQILATKAPEKWLEYCSPDYLCHIEAGDSSCVYTTFTVAGHDDGVALSPLHQRARLPIATFPSGPRGSRKRCKWTLPRLSSTTIASAARVDVLKWTKAKDCPKRAQLNPEMNQWQALDKEEIVKSCRIEPEAKKRQLKAHGGGALHGAIGKKSFSNHLTLGAKSNRYHLQTEDVVEWELAYRMGPKGTYSISEVGNVLRIVQYKHSDGVVDAASSNADAAEATDAHDGTANGHAANDEDEDEDEDNDL